MIIIDYSNICMANLLAQLGSHTNVAIEVDILRPMILNSIRTINAKFKHEYGQVIIACDAKNYWRRDVFPYYKANRKKARESIDLDWPSVFKCMDIIREELAEFFPYRVIRIDGAEADDIIGTLCRYTASSSVFEEGGEEPQPVIILSRDGDFVQLQRYSHVKQYDPIGKKLITCDNPEAYLKEHIIRGDNGDGVPNFLSADNCLVMKVRQSPITKKNLAIWLDKKPEDFCDKVQLKNYYRNKTLVDLTETPEPIQQAIITSYKDQEGKNRSRLFNYFVTRKLRYLFENLQDF